MTFVRGDESRERAVVAAGRDCSFRSRAGAQKLGQRLALLLVAPVSRRVKPLQIKRGGKGAVGNNQPS